MILRTAAAAAFSAAAVILSLAAPVHALEVDPEAPVVVDDSLTLWPGESQEIDVLANDTDPGGADLDVCRLHGTSITGSQRDVSVLDESMFGIPDDNLLVQAGTRARGTHVVDYYVCNLTRLTPAHLTVTIRPVQPVDVAPGAVDHINVTNRNAKSIRFITLSRRGCDIDELGRVGAGQTRSFEVRNHRVAWFAVIGHGGVADSGTVKGVELSKAPPAPTHHGGIGCGWILAGATSGIG